MALRVHPGIGVARVGDSPEMFVGPETVDIPATPAGGYRDEEGRIRRQAACFRVFDDTTAVAGTSVTWSVTFGTAASNGIASITGANQVVSIIAGGAVKAELRTDADGNLLVLSCELNSAGTNGCGDGLVQATVGSGPSVAAISSWVVIVPPDFAPGILPKLPVSFLFLDWLCAHGLSSPPATATSLSFRRVIYPAIRGRTSLSPSALLALATPAERTTAVPFYVPGLGEPAGIEGAYLHAVVAHFHAGTFVNDWTTPTPLEPDTLDLGPLSFVDGSCWSGWELRFSVPSATLPFSGAELRFGPATTSPGVLPPFFGWAADVPACWDEWATVTRAPVSIGDWRTRGFYVQTGGGLVYQDTNTIVTLLTTMLDFGSVQRGSAVARRIEFNFEDYFHPLPFEFVTLPAPLEVLAMTGTVASPPQALTVIFRAAMTEPLGPVTLPACEVKVEGQTFFVPAIAEVVAPETTQLALVLDCSTSMEEDRGDGLSKLLGLKAAVDVVIEVARQNDGIALAPFSDNALPGLVARSLGPTPGDARRLAVHDFVRGLTTVGSTSIGDGIVSARSLLTTTPDSFDHAALVVITDGVETAPAWLRDVASSIGEDTFAVGIGTSSNINEDHLREITSGHRGYLVLTGDPASPTNDYILEKYLLQILAGATNDQVIVDPVGRVVPGVVSRVPIAVSEAEFRIEVVVVADRAKELALALMGPDGTVHTFEDLASEPGVEIVRNGRLGLARVPVPLIFSSGQTWQPGPWTLLLAERNWLGKQPPAADLRQLALSTRPEPNGDYQPISYAAVVNARSSLALTARIDASSFERSRLTFEASIGYAGTPLRSTPLVSADVRTPLGSTLSVALEPVGDGRFVGQLPTSVRGDYSARLRAHGFSPRGYRFARELTLTPSVGVPPSPDRSRYCECHSKPKHEGFWQCLLAACRKHE